MIVFHKQKPIDGKSCYSVHKDGEFNGVVRYFADTKEWGFINLNFRVFRFFSLAESRDEAFKW